MELMGLSLKVPDHTTLSRRSQNLDRPRSAGIEGDRVLKT